MRALPCEIADRYVDCVCALFNQARLSREYLDVTALQNHLRMMHSRAHHGLYPALEVDVETGLPTYKEWARVRADFSVAGAALSQKIDEAQLKRRAIAEPDSIYGKQWLKHLYYSALRGTSLASLDHLSVSLRKIEDGFTRAQITLDRLDGQGLWRRCTMLLGQHGEQDSLFTVGDDDGISPSESLHAALYRMTALDAELTFARFAVMPGVQVERVCTTTLGPILLQPLSPQGPLSRLLSGAEGVIAQFAIDMASRDLAMDRDNDPLSDARSGRLSDEQQRAITDARTSHGYHVYRDRKFVTDAASQHGLDEYCRRLGTRNVIYGQAHGL